MQNQSIDDQKESKFYHFSRKSNWGNITVGILLMFLVMVCIAYWSVRSSIGLQVSAVIFLFLWWPLLDALHLLPFSTAGIDISKQRIALLQRNGKEKKSITEVREIKTGGLSRRVEISGLSPKGEKTRIKLVRAHLTKKQYEDLAGYLQQLFPISK